MLYYQKKAESGGLSYISFPLAFTCCASVSHLESEDNNTQPKEASRGLVPWDFAYPASLNS